MTISGYMDEVVVIEEIACQNGDGIIAKVTINRPDKLNALNQEVVKSLKEMCNWAEENDSVRCVIITGAKPNPPLKGKERSHTLLSLALISRNSQVRTRKKFANCLETMLSKQFGT